MAEKGIIDRVVGAISPSWALRRQVARDVIKLYEKQRSRGTSSALTRGGTDTRTNEDWRASTSYLYGNTAEWHSFARQRNRARQADRNNAIARSILNTETDYVVGTGLTLQARTASPKFNAEVEERWSRWIDRADLTGRESGLGLQRMIFRQYKRDGDIGVVLVDRGGPRLQVVPGDLIMTPDKRLPDRNIVSGVEFNDLGAYTRFHVLTTTEAGRREFKSVEAKNFVYIARRTEANQVRGESCFAQVFDLLNQVDLYVDAVVIAARMAAIFGLIFKERTAQQQFGALPTMTNAKGDAQRAVTLENGLVKYVGQQDDVVQVQAQQPMSQTPDFVRAMLRMIGLPFDMPLEIIARDMSKVNFISGRLGLAGYYRAKDVEARAYAHHWSRIYQWWISKMVKSGELSEQAPDRFWNHEFTRSPGAMADPRGELQAALLEISMGIQSPQRYAASLGRDYESIQRQLDEIGWPRGGVLSTFTRDAGQLPPESNDENTQE